MMDALEKSIIFHLIKNSIGSYDWSKKDIIENLDLLEKEVNNQEEIKLKKEILKLKSSLEKDTEFFLDVIVDIIKEGNLEIIKLIKDNYSSIKEKKNIVKLKDFKCKILQLEKSILATLIINPKNPYLAEASKQMQDITWLQNR